jgi:hypothetical protein
LRTETSSSTRQNRINALIPKKKQYHGIALRKKVSRRRSPPDLTGGESFPAMESKLWRPLRLLILLLLPLSASWTAAEDDPAVARSAFPIDGDVAWVVQISDLHISAYHPERAEDLVNLLGPALRAICPHLLLVTGDITGAPTPPISFGSPISRLMYPSVPEYKAYFDCTNHAFINIDRHH